MQKFRFNAARLSVEKIANSGLCEGVYTGPMTSDALVALRTEGLRAAAHFGVCIVRLEKSLILMGDDVPVEAGAYDENTPPGALIVRPDQYSFFQAYALKAAKYGVIRTVWVESNAQLAYAWALRRSHLYNAKSQH